MQVILNLLNYYLVNFTIRMTDDVEKLADAIFYLAINGASVDNFEQNC